jgi:hypothetical protein
MDWIYLAQDMDQWRALVNTVMNLQVPWNAGNFLSGCTIGSLSRRAQLHEWVMSDVRHDGLISCVVHNRQSFQHNSWLLQDRALQLIQFTHVYKTVIVHLHLSASLHFLCYWFLLKLSPFLIHTI